jgi:hypothetical protein
MDKKVIKPKRVRRPKGMRRARGGGGIIPKPPAKQLNVFHYFPGGGGLSSMVPSNYSPRVMDQMRPNQARNDLVEPVPEPAPEPAQDFQPAFDLIPPPPLEVVGVRSDYSNYTPEDIVAIREHDRLKLIPKRDRSEAEQFLFDRFTILKKRSDYNDFINSSVYNSIKI